MNNPVALIPGTLTGIGRATALASDKARFHTRQCLAVDGGFTVQ